MPQPLLQIHGFYGPATTGCSWGVLRPHARTPHTSLLESWSGLSLAGAGLPLPSGARAVKTGSSAGAPHTSSRICSIVGGAGRVGSTTRFLAFEPIIPGS